MEDADRVRDIAEKLARNDRNEVRLALDFEGGKSEVGEDSVPELYLTPARRQKLQKLGVIERVDTGENTPATSVPPQPVRPACCRVSEGRARGMGR